MGFYSEFFDETIQTIEKAFNLVVEKVSQYYTNQRKQASQVHYDIINKEEKKTFQLIKIASDFIKTTARSTYAMDEGSHQELMSIIKSALEVYLNDLERQVALTSEDAFKEQAKEVVRVLNLESIKKTEGGRFDKYYKKVSIQSEGKTLEVFLCYSSKDGKLASKIKNSLESHGMKVFMAHEDIEPSEEWRKEILTHLESCNVIVALDTDNFNTAPYPNQEVGIAMGKGKMVIPISFTKKRSGFLESKQAIEAKIDDIEPIIKELVDIIVKKQA